MDNTRDMGRCQGIGANVKRLETDKGGLVPEDELAGVIEASFIFVWESASDSKDFASVDKLRNDVHKELVEVDDIVVLLVETDKLVDSKRRGRVKRSRLARANSSRLFI